MTMATNLPSCFFIQFLEQLLKFLVNFTLLKHVKSQRTYGFLITKELIFGFQILDLKDHFSASLKTCSNMILLHSGNIPRICLMPGPKVRSLFLVFPHSSRSLYS